MSQLKPLEGKTIILTRTREDSTDMAAKLEQHGARVHVLPLIRFEAVEPDEEVNSQDFDWSVFTSSKAVRYFFEVSALRAQGLAATKVVSIGPATIKSLQDRGVTPDFESKVSSSAGLLDALSSEDMSGSKVLLPRSDIATRDLPEGLVKLGADICERVVYRTMPDSSNVVKIADLAEAGEAEALCLMSGSAAKSLADGFGDGLQAMNSRLEVFSIGPQTTDVCKACGISVAQEAKVHTAEGIIETLVGHYTR